MLLRLSQTANVGPNAFLVIHPLDDGPEEKRDVSALGPMPMTRSVRFSLLALRAYLLLMIGLVAYHVLVLAGAFEHLAH